MIVYPDTSFILSLWHTGDTNYAEALKLFFQTFQGYMALV